MAERPTINRPVEPVHWGARLVRAPGVVYTEVAGTPVLVRVDDAELQPMSPAWVSCWAGLDGRPVAEALDVDPDTVDPITSRNLIEVLRRLKAKRLIADVDSLSPDDRAAATSAFPDDQPVAGPTDIVLRGHLAESPDGPILTLPAPTASLAGDEVDHGLGDTRPDLLTVHLAEVNGTLTPSIVGAKLTIVTESRPEIGAGGPDGDASRCIHMLANLLAALDDSSCLAAPGVVDLLAALAETLHVTAPRTAATSSGASRRPSGSPPR